jgi:hypothetical protein
LHHAYLNVLLYIIVLPLTWKFWFTWYELAHLNVPLYVTMWPLTWTSHFYKHHHYHCRIRHRGGLKNYHGKEQISGILFFNGEWSCFKESPPSIMVTRNHNWSTEILWFMTGYVKGKILSPLKHPAWGRLHCWFCLKLLNVY